MVTIKEPDDDENIDDIKNVDNESKDNNCDSDKEIEEDSIDGVIEFDDFYKFRCPHCHINIVAMKNEINCLIFRCGQFKKTGENIPPHMSKIECDRLKLRDLIYGCSKPFRLVRSNKNFKVEPCGYI
jgi:hypothetical protein